MKKGFTLSELMIALGVLGLLCATVLPAIVNTMPNQNKILIKRAYYNTSNIVKDMINNKYFYDLINVDSGEFCVGFDDSASITYKGKTYSGNTKFPDIFITQLNTKAEVDESEDFCDFRNVEDPDTGVSTDIDTCRTVLTSDGMRWTFGIPKDFGDGTWYGNSDRVVAHILVDINGERKPNCYQGNESDVCKDRKRDFDQFRMNIYTDGTIKVQSEDVWARSAINPSTSLTHDEP